MEGSIFVIDANHTLVEMRQERYENEYSFQTLIEKYPNLLAGEQINPDDPRRWIFVARELGVPSDEDGGDRWFLDHLFIDQDAIPTLVEVKRSSDTRIRREVVAQMLDYAANASSFWSVDTIRQCYLEQVDRHNTPTLTDIGVNDSDHFWQTVESNLQLGKMRLLFVADEIPLSLQSIIEFLNRQMTDVEVLGLEIRQYASSTGMRTLVPRIVGRTANAVQAKERKKHKWAEDSFLEDIRTATKDEACVDFCKRLLSECEKMGLRVWWGEGKRNASFVAIYDGTVRHQLFAVWPVKSDAVVEIYFQHFKAPLNTQEAKLDLKHRLEQIEGLHISESKLDKRPNFSWKMLRSDDAFTRFVGIVADMKERIERYEGTLTKGEQG